jgi:lysine/ornithine N-monooxygenase
MPADMLLRSDWAHTSMSAPGGAGTLDAWAAATGEERREPIPLDAFLRYGAWFRERFVPDLHEVDVERIEAAREGLVVTTVDGGRAVARRVVAAVGVLPFPRVPAAFRGVEDDRIGYAVGGRDLGHVRGLRVAVVGGGQNALETAVLAAEAGAASVEMVVRSAVRWFASREPSAERSMVGRELYRLAYPIVGFGPPPLNRLVLHPDLWARLPRPLAGRLAGRILRSGGAPWIRDRLEGAVHVREGREVAAVEPTAAAVRLRLSDGTVLEVDHVIVAAGFRFHLDGLTFLDPALRAAVAAEDGLPVLDRAFRTTEPRLSLVGFAAEHRFGPLSRYVEGTRFTGARLAEAT